MRLFALCLSLMLTNLCGIGFKSSAFASSAASSLEICGAFQGQYLRTCGGKELLLSDWFGPDGSTDLASIGTALPTSLQDLQEAQDGWHQNWLGDPSVTGERSEPIILGCSNVRLAILNKNGQPVIMHLTALCSGNSVNYYAQGALFAPSAAANFKQHIAMLLRDLASNR